MKRPRVADAALRRQAPMRSDDTSIRQDKKPKSQSLEPPRPDHEEVLNAAVVAALDAGIVATTVKHVTSRAAISNSRFYEVFGKAENLIPKIVDHCWALIARRVALETFHEVPDGPTEGILAMYRSLVRMIDDEVSRAAVEVVLAVERRDLEDDLTSWSPGRPTAKRMFEQKSRAWCERLVSSGDCAYQDPDRLQRDLWLAFAATFTAWLWASQRLDGDSVADACAARLEQVQREIILNGVQALQA